MNAFMPRSMLRRFGPLAAILTLTAGAAGLPASEGLPLRIHDLGSRFAGDVGIAVRDLERGATADYRGTDFFPQHSVFKLWLAAAVFAAADRGELQLSDRIVVRREDLGFPYQPIAAKIVGNAGYATTFEELVRYIVIHSDNPSADVLLRRLGGTAAVQSLLEQRGISDVRVDASERELHAQADALQDQLARDPARRDDVLARWFATAGNRATPLGALDALTALHAGALLTPGSTESLKRLLAETQTGANRLKAGLEPGWQVAHKTGSGGEIAGVDLGTNDAGFISAPDGRTYAVVVFVANSRRPAEEREALIAAVAAAIVADWKAQTAIMRLAH